MRKYGKYERRPEGVPGKQKKAKNMLLQTYFAGLICFALCVTMFFGTTYAWFTSEVMNEGNEIYIGTLDAKLEVLKDSQWVNLEECSPRCCVSVAYSLRNLRCLRSPPRTRSFLPTTSLKRRISSKSWMPQAKNTPFSAPRVLVKTSRI